MGITLSNLLSLAATRLLAALLFEIGLMAGEFRRHSLHNISPTRPEHDILAFEENAAVRTCFQPLS